ncbi:unnamed protein product [Psylliodes chrysocephalus]|uniref:beta-glucosidase n=1 Tax=Psylliodes chrysocephalus TaxID=3402493 RepID=A0A9P0GAK0_9CUCU|nr:unnamed protein product [Psylliodes chrysocephala]
MPPSMSSRSFIKRFWIEVVLYLPLSAMSDKKEDELSFPSNFLFGVASSAYQIEGGYNADGRGESVYDFYTHKNPEKFDNSSNGDITCDSYNQWRKDVKLLIELGVDFYRFSISWSRILPNGYANKINQAGVKYYNDLIDELIANGIQPMVTINHMDLPMSLQHLGGWTNTVISDHFMNYAKILFENFGDRVKHWITINTTSMGYNDDIFPPYMNQPGIADYLAIRVMVLSHAKVYRLYQKEFSEQKGKIGLVVDTRWFEPVSSSEEDIRAAEIVMEFEVGIYLNPFFHPNGDFPEVVKKRVEMISKIEGYPQSRLPSFTPDEIDFIKGSCDFIGTNLYTSFLVENREDSLFNTTSIQRDEGAKVFQDASWKKSASDWLTVYPEGAQKALRWIKEKYNSPEIIITENGFSDLGGINDDDRIDYLRTYLKAILRAIYIDKVNVRGYAVWSLMDNFEWASGYREKFGLYSVDFNDLSRPRTKKKSATWYQNVIKEKRIMD